jgi:hypothetical protein
MAAVDGLVNFRTETSEGIAGASRFSSKPKRKDETRNKKIFGGGEPKHAANNGRLDGKAISQGSKQNFCYFIFNGNHFARDCSKREKLNAREELRKRNDNEEELRKQLEKCRIDLYYSKGQQQFVEKQLEEEDKIRNYLNQQV